MDVRCLQSTECIILITLFTLGKLLNPTVLYIHFKDAADQGQQRRRTERLLKHPRPRKDRPHIFMSCIFPTAGKYCLHFLEINLVTESHRFNNYTFTMTTKVDFTL